MNHHDTQCCLSLLLLPEMGTALSRLLLAAGSPTAALNLSETRLTALGIRAATVNALLQLNGQPEPSLARMADTIAEQGIVVLGLYQSAYPPRLREIARPPAVLFVRGNPNALNQAQLAMVGSRKPTPGGRKLAKGLAKALTKYGLTITSGLAIGIDTESHRGAIESGVSLAVMGTGPDRIYPWSNRELADAIIATGGALITEFVPGTRPEASNFPRRNRIISGLSLGVLVVEAALPSGSLLTAQYAAEQNREVMAVPGSVMSGVSGGCHMLLRNGAALVESAEDVLLALGDRFRPSSAAALAQQQPLSFNPDRMRLSDEQRRIYDSTGFEGTSLDMISAMAGLDSATAASAMVVLELMGYVAQTPGGYIRAG